MKKVLLLLVCAALLAGCESDEERAHRHDALCKSYGAKPQTPEYIQCRATIHLTEHNQEEINSAQAMSAFAFGMSAGTSSRR